ncbi:RNA polymerase sigma factor [Paremcibacter congregatus]|uniref:RNA polymerase subunit sigma-24 n=1 Tax=Paremcibacter congregatus TaxID=2043170 RepID=A0A2G4YP76_9PROT|nr:DUF6596 domain-containing protein [Paremcibacter congregatus]PHZ84129.1 RNA polymerase subunit sigma-24 [Paremcibacter congregatus]QDE25810.1 RNA polymerase sigma factor [Paremcibacter congregatus]
MAPPLRFDVALQAIVKETWGSLLSGLIRRCGDFQLAEDSLQDAVETALTRWRETGLPDHPQAWLYKVAWRKALDRMRRDQNFHKKQAEVQFLLEQEQTAELGESDYDIPDERLRLIFTCCHPALDRKVSVALTLQLVGGLTTAEIARAYLVKPETMAQRLVRGKRKIRTTAIAYEIPSAADFADRLSAVLAVLYLIFNEGYAASFGAEPIRKDLCLEAIRLARILCLLCPTALEAHGLLALMLLHDSRRPARYDCHGAFIPLEDQDRTVWLKDQSEEGRRLVRRILAHGARRGEAAGVYQLQAAISAVHSDAMRAEETNWREISLIYELLYRLKPTPVIALNRLVARSYVEPLPFILEQLQALAFGLENYQAFYAVEADFHRRLGQRQAARTSYLKAIELSANEAEQAFLTARMQAL